MTLYETIERIKADNPSKEQFEAIMESMRRRAQKGLIPGVTVQAINEAVTSLEKNILLAEQEELIKMISEVDTVCKKYDYLSEDYEMTDEEFEGYTLYEFYKAVMHEINLSEGIKDDYYDWRERTLSNMEDDPVKYAKYSAGAGAVAGVAATSPFIIDTARRHALRKDAMDRAYANSLSAGDSIEKAKEVAANTKQAFNTDNPSLIKKIGGGISKKMGAFNTWAQAHPIGATFAAGAAAAGIGGLAAWLIRRRRKKKEMMMREGIEDMSVFSESTLLEVRDTLLQLPENIILSLCENYNELITSLSIDALNFKSDILDESQSLNEDVTYISNSGTLKTTTTKEYVEDMHKYEKTFQFNSLKKKDKKSLKENELSYKKLSEMTLEEILSEGEIY